MIYLPIIGESRGRMAGTDGGGLTVEFYKSTTTLARDALGWGRVDRLNESVISRRKGIRRELTAGVGAVTWEVRNHALVASLLGGGGACRRGGAFTPVVWGTGGSLCRVALVYMPGKEITPGELVSTMLALVRSIAGVCMCVFFVRWGGKEKGERTDGISYALLHVEDE